MKFGRRVAQFDLPARYQAESHLPDLKQVARGEDAQQREDRLHARIPGKAGFQGSEVQLCGVRLHVDVGKRGIQRVITHRLQHFRGKQGAEKRLPRFAAHALHHERESALVRACGCDRIRHHGGQFVVKIPARKRALIGLRGEGSLVEVKKKERNNSGKDKCDRAKRGNGFSQGFHNICSVIASRRRSNLHAIRGLLCAFATRNDINSQSIPRSNPA
ncbi:MAG: hypothetical protein C4557_02395 [Anaerolineaceae bacterium]|nr:MAG: hypothetical protein C4557_02395 [Anaerolineaceae bacterium]